MTLKLLLAGRDLGSFQPIKTAFDEEDVFMIMATSIGLALFLARKNQPHLIICEEQLIDGDGRTLFYEIRNELELSHIPFALLLANKHEQSTMLGQLLTEQDKSFHCLYIENEAKGQETISDWKNQILQIIG